MIYFDYNATTPIDPAVTQAMIHSLQNHHGNPSSSHRLGKAVRAAIEELRKVMSDGTKEQIDESLKKLDTESHRVAQILYQKSNAEVGQESGGGTKEEQPPSGDSAQEGEVIDAEVVDVDESKR